MALPQLSSNILSSKPYYDPTMPPLLRNSCLGFRDLGSGSTYLWLARNGGMDPYSRPCILTDSRSFPFSSSIRRSFLQHNFPPPKAKSQTRKLYTLYTSVCILAYTPYSQCHGWKSQAQGMDVQISKFLMVI